jgi:hypothetical protein
LIKRASLRRRLARFPGLFVHHYRLLRKHNGRFISGLSSARLSLRLLENTWE